MSATDPIREAHRLRDAAERYLHLACGADQAAHDSLVMYASEMLERAQALEAIAGAGEPGTRSLPGPPY